MTLYRDLDNNYFIGDASYDQVSYQLNSNVTLANIYGNLLALMVTSGWSLNYLHPETQLKTIYNNNAAFVLLMAGANSDPTVKRLIFYYGASNTGLLNLYNDSGVSTGAIAPPPTLNREMLIGNVLSGGSSLNTQTRGVTNNGLDSDYRFLAVSDGKSLGYLHTQPRVGSVVPIARNNYQFTYVGILEDHNSSYLGNNLVNRYIFLTSMSLGSAPHSSGYYNFATETTGQNIICGKILTPSGEVRIAQNMNTYYPYDNLGDTQWVTDFIAYGEGGNLLGKVKNLKIANGFYFPLKPIKLTNYTEDGNNTWIPVGILGGKTVLMRCVSGEVLNEDLTSIPLTGYPDSKYCPMDITPYYSF
jgi:hypothetical protein